MRTFRELRKDESRVILVRHAPHKNNIILPKYIMLCQAIGRALKQSGIELASCVSSSILRAKSTAENILNGADSSLCVIEALELIDLMALAPDAKIIAKAEAIATSLNFAGDEGLFKIMFDSSFPEFYGLVKSRGEETANFLRQLAEKNQESNCLIVTHLGRIPNSLQILHGEEIHPPDRLAGNCQVIELIFSKGKLIKENWLDINELL
ncbi:MAG: histidine phosphatase family protein [Patescibacteria group bacterium]|jgi:broad specificity phosphatase PhoE